ncbi:MAG: hypothetical protein SVU88_03705 [Candidatus Nanohaloarchaea archaeon]|nr:hypothetical protein [Candidatus Nanohaloarchaea archaeon]
MRRLLAAAVLVALVAPLAAGQQSGFEGEVESIRVGQNATVNATVVNPLPVSDTLLVVFDGDAITEGIVTPHFPDSDDITCEQLQSRCTIQMGPDSEKGISIILEGTAIGQETLTATVNSTTTQLSSSDSLNVRVKPFFGSVTVSAPGIQWLHAAVLAVLSALAYGYLLRE